MPDDYPAHLLYDNEGAIAKLLEGEVLYANSFPIKYPNGSDGSETLVLFVNCNDLFYWGTADAEHVTLKEVQSLYEAWKSGTKWGVSIWCCKKRNMQPQVPIVKDMKADGAWTEELEAFPKPPPS